MQKAPQLCYYGFSSDLMTKPHHFCSLPTYMLLKPPLPHCCCLAPIFSSLNKSNTILILLSLSSQPAPDLSDWSPWAISKFLPHLFTLPLLKIGHCCPWLFRQCQNPWDILWSPLAFDLNTSLVSAYIPPHPCPRVPSLVPWATGPLHSSLWLEYPSLFPWTNLLLLNHFHIISPSHRSFFFFKWILF